MSFVGRLFGYDNPVKLARKIVDSINSLEPEFEDFSQAQLIEKTKKWQNEAKIIVDAKKLNDYLDSILPEAFASVRESAKRTLGQRHYDVQLIAGIMLHQRKVTEMKTGEGKTLAATLAVYLNALAGKGVHVVTVNDYLARRDASWMGQVYHYLGMSVASIQHDSAFVYSETDQADEQITQDESEGVQIDVKNMIPCQRKEAYQADILYGTNNEFGFDYLRDNMARNLEQIVQREPYYAIIDEVDSILIDEARTPLIISAPDEEGTQMYQEFSIMIKTFSERDYALDEKHRQVTYSEEGYQKLEKKYGQEIYSDIKLRHHADQALRAQTLFKKDRDYVVRENEIIIVDEFTGRLMHGRRYSEGLHQAIEAKEGVQVRQESKTLATITFQNYFRLYPKLGGMTGTAETEAEEFHKIYGLDVVVVPTNTEVVRKDHSDIIFKTEAGKHAAIVREIKERNQAGQPILIGTISIEKNEYLSKLLKKAGIKHEILNAKNNEREAQIIAQAGRLRAVTLATNIAGRGVDIILGGNPPEENSAKSVRDSGGLFVLGTERHESRRIDNQLRGRSGRQGDPGESRFFLSLEDDLMRLFGGDRLKNMMETLRVPEDQPIENRIVSKSIESAQKKIEGMNFDIRKHVLEFDDVLNKQRETIYRRRKEILHGKRDLKEQILESVNQELKSIVMLETQGLASDKWDVDLIYERVGSILPLLQEEKKKFESRDLWINHLTEIAGKHYKQKEELMGGKLMRQIEKLITLQSIDNLWVEHLDTMDHLRQSVRLRGYAQKDPLVEYKRDGLRLFQEMLMVIDKTIARTIYRVEVKPQYQQKQGALGKESRLEQMPYSNVSSSARNDYNESVQSTDNRSPQGDKIGRNDPCWCGAVNPNTGKIYKYKQCGLIDAKHHRG